MPNSSAATPKYSAGAEYPHACYKRCELYAYRHRAADHGRGERRRPGRPRGSRAIPRCCGHHPREGRGPESEFGRFSHNQLIGINFTFRPLSVVSVDMYGWAQDYNDEWISVTNHTMFTWLGACSQEGCHNDPETYALPQGK